MKSAPILTVFLLLAITTGSQQIFLRPSGIVTCLDHDEAF
jgi:hypothetical protein